jgi:uncharacterized protein (DUF1778 family)
MTSARRDRQIQIRASDSTQKLIDRAAAMTGLTRSQFMLETAIREAQNTLLGQRVFVLDAAQWTAFEAALDRPIDTAKLDALMAAKSPWKG